MKTKNRTRTRPALAFAILGLSVVLAGCGGGGGSDAAAAGSAPAGTDTNPSISGTPADAVAVNARYQFAPVVASNDSASLTFSIQNQPRWANFAVATGTLSGTPVASDAGNYANIVIAVTNGSHSTALPAFSIAVTSAAAVGYSTMTFGPNVTLDSNWFPWEFYGQGAQPAGFATQNADGSLYFSGTGHPSGDGAATAAHSGSGKNWTGTAFGGGAYFEAVLSFTGQGNGPYNNGGPAFWALDVEHTSQGPYDVSWPGQPNDSHGSPYDDYFEVDFMEYDSGTYAYQNGIGNWYGYPPTQSTSNPHQEVGGSNGSVLVPSGTNFAEYHSYGCLWVPATPSTQGYLKFYFDGVQNGATFYWNYNNPSNPFPPPPQNNSSAMSGMDARHLMLILGTGTDQPMTVKSVTVWQASGANNLTE